MSSAEEAKRWRKNNPEKEKEKHEKWRKANMEKVNAYQRERRKNNPHIERGKKYKNLYGITLDDYEKMYDEQNGMCAICGKHQSLLFVDHDHKNGSVRGLLCNKCNTGIGFFHDNIGFLEKAIGYLKK